MALSDRARKALEIALANSQIDPKSTAKEVADAVDSADETAASVSALGTTSDIGTTDGSGGSGDAALATDTENRLDNVESKIDEVINAMKNAGLMES